MGGEWTVSLGYLIFPVREEPKKYHRRHHVVHTYMCIYEIRYAMYYILYLIYIQYIHIYIYMYICILVMHYTFFTKTRVRPVLKGPTRCRCRSRQQQQQRQRHQKGTCSSPNKKEDRDGLCSHFCDTVLSNGINNGEGVLSDVGVSQTL